MKKNKYSIEELIKHVKDSYAKSNRGESKIDRLLIRMPGMTGTKTRHLYNNLCSLEGINYLEVGTFGGSSFASALYNNTATGTAIDNWSEFGGSVQNFLHNMEVFLNEREYFYIEKDCFSITKEDLPYSQYDVYLYDGGHTQEEQEKAITHYCEFLSDNFILIVDDHSWSQVKKGTKDGLLKANVTVHFQLEVDDDANTSNHGITNYWNGFGVFVCSKNNL